MVLSILSMFVINFELFSDGFSIIDTTPIAENYRWVETIPCSANIIYEELVEGRSINKYDLMLKGQPYIIHEDSSAHTVFKKMWFELPEYALTTNLSFLDQKIVYHLFRSLCSNRVWYVKQYHGIDDDGVCYILTKKLNSYPEWYTVDAEIKEFEESLIIVPISGAESRVIFISNFNYGGKLPTFFRNLISVERLKYLKSIKSLFYDLNQAKIYETLK